MSKTTEQKNQEEAFRAGVEHTVRTLLEKNVIVSGPGGYGSASKTTIDIGKVDEIDAIVFEIIHGTTPQGGSTQLI